MHVDHLNTPQIVTNQSQQVVWAASYEPFGRANIITNTVEIYSRFPGTHADTETGLYYNYQRYLDPSIGRFLESDRIGLQGGINTYAYVENNPMNFIDPTGENLAWAGRGGFFVGQRVVGPAINNTLKWAVGTASLGAVLYNMTHKDEWAMMNEGWAGPLDTGREGEDAANDDVYESDDGCIFWYEELTELINELGGGECLDEVTKKALNNSIANYNKQCGGYTPYIAPL